MRATVIWASDDIAHPGSEVGRALDCLNSLVDRLRIYKPHGRLELLFSDGKRVDLDPRDSPAVDAWELYGPGGLLASCSPGRGEPDFWVETVAHRPR